MMSDTNIIIAVAKLDGWLDVEEYTHNYVCFGERGELKQILGRSPDKLGELKHLKNYLTSRDAIITVIEKCINTKEEVWNFSVNLSQILTKTDEDYQELSPVDYLLSTPKQLSIALLKATGNYSEDKPL